MSYELETIAGVDVQWWNCHRVVELARSILWMKGHPERIRELPATAVNTAVTWVMREMSAAMKNIEILLQRMKARTETSRGVIHTVAPRDTLTETRRHDRASTSARARMSRVSKGTDDEGNLSSSDGSESEDEKYSSDVSVSNLSRSHASTNITTGIQTNGEKFLSFISKEYWKMWINPFTAVAERR
ncbi:hypothetical protein ACJMK2_011468 [Sinanodonta woodiana]|uniref:Uncharacterized protein n=1 Tax=Sinanodonta woodiana TaxID=1069815 RepID=A0ABD3V541_SINWO